MIKYILTILLLSPVAFCGAGGSVLKFKTKKVDYCNVYGAIYFEKEKGYADFSIYVEEDEAFADYVVFKEDSQAYADQDGRWYITDNKDFADFVIYLEKDRQYADFTVYYTEVASFSGCN